MVIRTLILVLGLCAALAPLADAQTIRRPPSYVDPYPVESLARVMGEMHYLDFACKGRDSQDWREAMLELLEHEAPTRGSYRQRLVDRFNEGFRIQERRTPRCGAEEEMVRQALAAEGETLSEQLRRTYLN
ncbi:TIGR02301 family protein [Oceanicaulis sp.]|jgi:uncharacterized protein (TIGR02301 family)|uniref:TIGR02301 family protein n=1 Tax=Oceanicaulis sp. TaxID=1924941 RepID=UPI003F70B22C